MNISKSKETKMIKLVKSYIHVNMTTTKTVIIKSQRASNVHVKCEPRDIQPGRHVKLH